MNSEANARIAESLGWTRCVCGDPECGAWFGPNETEPSLGHPNYFSPDLPVRVRLEMWEALTEEQREELVWEQIKEPRFPLEVDDLTTILHFALSPEFVPAWCAVKGIL